MVVVFELVGCINLLQGFINLKSSNIAFYLIFFCKGIASEGFGRIQTYVNLTQEPCSILAADKLAMVLGF
jgi:hypothetical protein